MVRAMTTPQLVPVLDTSGWQTAYIKNGRVRPDPQRPELTLAADRGVEGIFHRIGNGRSFDESAPLFYGAAIDADLDFGVYYYVQVNSLPPSQAGQLIERWLTENEIELDLPVMLDLEDMNGPDVSKLHMAEYIRQLADEVELFTGRRPILYSAAWWWNQRVEGDFTDFDTMQARYARQGTQPPSDPSQWWDFTRGVEPRTMVGTRPWDGYQFTAELNGGDFGIRPDAATQHLDGNLVRLEAWQRWAGVDTVEPIAPLPPVVIEEPVIDTSGWPPFRPAQGEFGLFPLDPHKLVLRAGDSGNLVKYVQGVIKTKAGGNIKVTGKMDDQTISRVRDVQAFFHITVDGIVGWDGSDGNDPGLNATWPIIDFLSAQPDSE